TPLSGAAMPTSASIFGDAAAGPLLAANDAMSPAALMPTQSTAEGAVVPGGLQSIFSGIPNGTPSGVPKELSGAAVEGSLQGPGKGAASPALPPGLIDVAQPASAVPGLDTLSTVAQPDLAALPASHSAAQLAEAASALPEASVTETVTPTLPEAADSEVAAPTAQPTTNGQAQATEAAWQPDAAERARAWRGIGTLDPSTGLLQGAGQGLASTGRHEFSLNYSAVAGQGGQLQQFAESLRQAGGVVDTSSPSSLQTAAQSSTASSASNAMQAADRGASLFNASSAGPELQQAWRGDSAAAGVTALGGRAAAGTLSFAQGMQASTFGQPLGQSFGDTEWAESVTKRVALMAGQKVSSAQIELDPPELGAMTVRVSVTGDQANVMFTSAHAQVREALEQTFTRLQDMLGQQGLQLADAQVSDQSAARQQQGDGRGGQGGGAVFTEEGEAGPVTMQTLKVPKGLVDYYA
ncbi:MAG: flagellar hook-length control protein FliK, partial [Pseudomonadota bacterium]